MVSAPADTPMATGICISSSEPASPATPIDLSASSWGKNSSGAGSFEPTPHHETAAAQAIRVAHLLIASSCNAAQQHAQFVSLPAQPLFLLPAVLPLIPPQLLHFFGSLPALVEAYPAAPLSASGFPHGTFPSARPLYQNVAYPVGQGVWHQGYYFPSYEHFLAYRRGVIAYNFHFYGIRPYFRLPPGLPRPRPPKSALATGGPHSTALAAPAFAAGPAGTTGSASSGGTGVPIPVGRVSKMSDEGDSPCCSPGSNSSTCSNGDSDDTASDMCAAEPEGDLLGDAPLIAAAMMTDAADCDQAAAAEAGGRVHHQSGCIAGVASCACAGGGAWLAASGGCSACAAPLALPHGSLRPLRCNPDTGCGRAGTESRGQVQEDARRAGGDHGAAAPAVAPVAAGSPTGGVYAQWLERQLAVLLDTVVSDAFLCCEDAV